MTKKKINKKEGILFWITGLPWSGTTATTNKIKNDIIKKYGPTIIFDVDKLRKHFLFKGHTYKEQYKIVTKYSKFAKFIVLANINVIFSVAGSMHKIRKWNRKNFKNYFEINTECSRQRYKLPFKKSNF